jgi:excisionase family DNA binding protein
MNQVLLKTNPDHDRLVNELKAHITEELKSIKSFVVEKPMTYQDAAKYLSISTRQLYRKIKAGRIPPSIVHRDDGTVYFLPSELHEHIKKS